MEAGAEGPGGGDGRGSGGAGGVEGRRGAPSSSTATTTCSRRSRYEWSSPPFEPAVRTVGSRPGSADNKGQFFLHLKATGVMETNGLRGTWSSWWRGRRRSAPQPGPFVERRAERWRATCGDLRLRHVRPGASLAALLPEGLLLESGPGSRTNSTPGLRRRRPEPRHGAARMLSTFHDAQGRIVTGLPGDVVSGQGHPHRHPGPPLRRGGVPGRGGSAGLSERRILHAGAPLDPPHLRVNGLLSLYGEGRDVLPAQAIRR